MPGYNLVGKRFGRLTVLKYLYSDHHGTKVWECKCDCGNFVKENSNVLSMGKVKSCGCLNKERIVALDKSRRTIYDISRDANGKHTKLYKIWCGIKRRCQNYDASHYKYYGKRGICVCDEWTHNFRPFYEWAISNGYQDGLTIDRIDNDKGYSPENCRWATITEQNRNKRCNTIFSYRGVAKTLAEWSDIVDIDPHMISGRVKRGWSFEDAITIRPNKHNHYPNHIVGERIEINI